MQIAAAYEVLADGEKRKLYDQVSTYMHTYMHVTERHTECKLTAPQSSCLSYYSLVRRACDQMAVLGDLVEAFPVAGEPGFISR